MREYAVFAHYGHFSSLDATPIAFVLQTERRNTARKNTSSWGAYYGLDKSQLEYHTLAGVELGGRVTALFCDNVTVLA